MVTNVTSPGQHLLETNNVDRVDFQRGEKIHYKDKAKVPLMAYYSEKGAQKSSKTDLIKLFRGELMSRRYTFSGGTVADGAVGTTETLTIGSTANLVVGMTIYIHKGTGAAGDQAGAFGRITAITTDTNITFRYLVKGSAAVVNSDSFVPIGYASAEDARDGPTYTDIEPETVTGYLTILKWPVEMSITERDSAVYAASSREQEKIDRSRMDFQRVRECNAWFSRGSSNISSNKVRTSMGFHEQLVAGVTFIDGGGSALTDAQLGNAIANGARYFDTFNFAFFHGAPILAGLFTLGTGKLHTRPSDGHYGFPAQIIDVAQYSMHMVHSQLFDIAGAPFLNMGAGMDLGSTENWYLKGEGQMQLKRNVDPVQSGKGEVVTHMWRAQEGVTTVVPQRHFALENVGSPT